MTQQEWVQRVADRPDAAAAWQAARSAATGAINEATTDGRYPSGGAGDILSMP